MSSALKVKTSPRPGSRLALEVEIPGGRSQASYEAAVTKLSRSVRLPGFRQGKVPRPVLLQQIGPLRIRATALEDLVDSVWRDALKQEQIAALSNPELSEGFDVLLARFSPGEELTLTLELDIQPTPSLKTTKGLVAEAEPIHYDPDRVDELIEQSRRQLAAMVPVENRPAASGDQALVSFTGSYQDSGEPIVGGSADDLEVELEEGRMIPGFIEGILGMGLGETRTIPCQFPDDYPQEDARGREASFVLTLKDLKARELPELDDAFAQQASELPTLAEMRADLEQRLRDDTERRARNGRHDALLTALVQELEVELPETLIQQEIRALVEQTASQVAQQGMDIKSLFTPELVRSLMDSSRPEAEQRLKRGLALQALATKEQITVEEGEIEAKLKEVGSGQSKGESIDPARLRGAVAEDLLRNKLLAWLEENSTVTEKAPAEGTEPAID
ncbi:trigger factor [Synechococcus sp. Tobar12-5m-g]|uniref:trigger factor n=1 Tax=unclassified Synechococcus TaxID=2626047 RepID=UPI0020CD06FE|nr:MULTISPECIES: trigger factor [unclassified Synechococcus]MCP9772416.1 trigger factor [Synechococcus sp. Tobar12-5m-g]MCP9874003.1 trigger factor [Synechococcus sp. Cruz CV-v-12]